MRAWLIAPALLLCAACGAPNRAYEIRKNDAVVSKVCGNAMSIERDCTSVFDGTSMVGQFCGNEWAVVPTLTGCGK